MPILYGPWMGTSFQARIKLIYAVDYTADNTQAIFNGTFYLETGGSVSDSVNSWGRTGDLANASGSNLVINTPSGGGLEAITSFPAFNKYGDASVRCYVDGINAVGSVRIEETFTLVAGALAPYFTDDTYFATSITSSAFTVTGYTATANGGTLNNVQVQYNVGTASATGASIYTKGSYANPTVSGLTRGTLYWYRLRVSDSGYGYGAWGPWHSVTTLATVPSAPTGWSFTNVQQTEFSIVGISVADNGGAGIDQILVRYSTDPAFATYTDVPLAGSATSVTVTGLQPGSTYYARVFAHNSIGYSAPSTDQSTTSLPGVLVNVGAGVWKTAVPYVNVGGIWKPASRFVNVSGVWKL